MRLRDADKLIEVFMRTYDDVEDIIEIIDNQPDELSEMELRAGFDVIFDEVKEREARKTLDRLELLIPRNTPYCYTPIGWNEEGGFFETKPCPYWDMTTVNDPQYGECAVEWCHYLGKELSVQDQVKDCGISVWED